MIHDTLLPLVFGIRAIPHWPLFHSTTIGGWSRSFGKLHDWKTTVSRRSRLFLSARSSRSRASYFPFFSVDVDGASQRHSLIHRCTLTQKNCNSIYHWLEQEDPFGDFARGRRWRLTARRKFLRLFSVRREVEEESLVFPSLATKVCHAKEETTTAAIERESYRVIAISRKYPLSLSLSLSLSAPHCSTVCVRPSLARCSEKRLARIRGQKPRERRTHAHTHRTTQKHTHAGDRRICKSRVAYRDASPPWPRTHRFARKSLRLCVRVYAYSREPSNTHGGRTR